MLMFLEILILIFLITGVGTVLFRAAKMSDGERFFYRSLSGGFRRAFSGRASNKPLLTNAGMAVNKTTGEVKKQHEISDLALR